MLLSFSTVGAAWQSPGLWTVVSAVLAVVICGVMVTRARRSKLRRLKSQLLEVEHRYLVEAVQSTPVSMAVYTPEDKLLVCNQAYRSMFPAGFAFYDQDPDAVITYPGLLRHNADPDMKPSELEAEIAKKVALWHALDNHPIERFYEAVGWRHVTKFHTPSGAVAGFAVNINALKDRERELEEEIARRKALELKLTELANTDSLTKVTNRRRFMELTEAELKRARRNRHGLSFMVLDIDWFKSINDRFGHQAGDEALVSVSKTIKACIREDIDQLGRLGGEEFGVLLPETNLADAMACAERICAAISALEISSPCAQGIRITASVGLSGRDGIEETSLTTLYGQADEALYAAKHGGRNQVVTFEAPKIAAPIHQ
ncbi:MAG: GGDEF domain-containing protein [Burkholderiaceae bacterium]